MNAIREQYSDQGWQYLASLKKLSGPAAKVLRCGNVATIPSSEVTVGDIVMLDAGHYIPADGRLTECAILKLDGSADRRQPRR